MSCVKEKRNKEIQEFINTHDPITTTPAKELIEWLKNDTPSLDMEEIEKKYLPKLLKITPHEIRVNSKRYKACNLNDSYLWAVHTRVMEILHYLSSEEEHQQDSCIKFYIKENNKFLNYIMKQVIWI